LSLRLRILVVMLVLVTTGPLAMALLVRREARPHVFGATEDSLAETAVVLASLVEASMRAEPDSLRRSERGDWGGQQLAPPAQGRSHSLPVTDPLRKTLDLALHRTLHARIYSIDKTRLDLRVYVTDARGVVLFDSDQGRDEGRDYSQWRDVARALRGEYGSRATRQKPGDPFSAVFYVAVPLRHADRIVGTLAVGKPAGDVKSLVASLERAIALAGLGTLAAAVLLGLVLARWVTGPIERLAGYAAAVGEGRRPPMPPLGTHEVAALGRTLESMRDALDGRRDVEGYVRGLTHETKAPLAAIRASAELLEEGLPPADEERFLANIRSEVERLQSLVDRLLELSALEARHSLAGVTPVDLAAIAAEVAKSVAPLAAQKDVAVDVAMEGVPALPGDPLLLRQALMNLVHNAVRWTPAGGRIRIAAETDDARVAVHVDDTGPGVADYAQPRVFERFYSVPPPGEPRGTGLGLPFVREVAVLHGGEARLENRREGGARATLALPRAR
jgi:two-component system sensor histidine kinase CreC